jgi:cell division protein FtsI/penicillin-binding protein 2
VRTPSALVALRPSDGHVLAVSVAPDPGGYDLALQGRYPPGSTFKVVSALALLAGGLGAGDLVDCPATATVDGRVFRNAEHEVLGRIPFHAAFAHSCNTAFVGLAPRLAFAGLRATAGLLGVGRPWRLGVPAFAGSVPQAGTPVELAAAVFGQADVLVSPIALASLAGAVAHGSWVAPRLVLDTGRPSAAGPPLPAGPLATLRALMREVVVSGTGTALGGVPGAPVAGKTGTAEYGTDTPPRTHAWFIGYQGDLAFAVLVSQTGHGFGGTVAAPIAARFLRSLGR